MLSASPNLTRRNDLDPESGFVLLAVIFLAVVLLISLAIAAPKIATSIRREKEIELVHRGEQYKRAIQLYYRKFGAYPTSIDQLVQTNQIRFLRKRYTDPITGKDDWKPVYYGQAHVRPLGFFGQPLSGVAGIAGVAMGGTSSSMYAVTTSATDANGVPIANPDGSSTSATGATGTSAGSAFGQSSTGSSFGSTGSSFGSTGSSFGSTGSGFGSTGSSFGSTGSTIGSSSPMGPSSPMGATSPTGSPTGASPFGSTGSGTSATSFGGTGPIVGFTLPSKKASLLDYKKQTHYNQWEFNYDPMEDQMKAAAAMMGGANNINNTTNATGSTPGFGSSGTQSTGNGMGMQMPGSTTSSPTSPTAPTAPTDPTSPTTSSPQP